MLCIVDCAAAMRAFPRELESDAKTTADKMPIIAITTRSSMRVKPCEPICCFLCTILFILPYKFYDAVVVQVASVQVMVVLSPNADTENDCPSVCEKAVAQPVPAVASQYTQPTGKFTWVPLPAPQRLPPP